MKTGFLLNGILELLGGILFILYPDIVYDLETNGLALAKMYGIIASCFGAISLVLWRHYEDTPINKYIYLICMGFHLFITFHCYACYKSGILPEMYASMTHLVMFGLLTLLYLKDVK